MKIAIINENSQVTKNKITKSCLNHRLRKIKDLATTLRNKQ